MVVAVKNNSMESSKMKRLMQRYAVSEKDFLAAAVDVSMKKSRSITTKAHNSSQNTSSLREPKLLSCEIGNRYNGSTPGSIEDSHKGVVKGFGIFMTRFKFESSIISCQETRKTDEHFAQRRVDIEIKFSLQVM
jgi:hypothetical protein